MRLIQCWNVFNNINNNNNNNNDNNNNNNKNNTNNCNNKHHGKSDDEASANLCRVMTKDYLFPGDFLTLQPDRAVSNGTFVVEPRIISKTYVSNSWPQPCVTEVVDGKLKVENVTDIIVPVHKNDHICQIFAIKSVNCNKDISSPTPKIELAESSRPFSQHVIIDPDAQLSPAEKHLFVEQHLKYDELFEPVIGRYNDFDGKVRARVNLGRTVPPTRKLQVPRYDKKNLDLLQDKFDDLERQGVFRRPEDIGVVIEHVSPSFLVKKRGPGHRLVTAFTSLGQFCKTLPVTMSTVDSVLRTLGKWKYLITTDLRDAFYQIPLEHDSIKWCGTVTPYRGLRCYVVAAQGMPGSSESLEEMLCTVLGEFVRQGWVEKIADDLNVGGTSIPHLLENWISVMNVLVRNGLKLKAIKTVIVPLHTEILGWEWHSGKISANSHKISTLSSCDPPKTVTAMRSFVGAFKTFNRVVRLCTSFLAPLEEMIVGKQKQDGLTWTDVTLSAFMSAQKALVNTPRICLPRPDDELLITHDGCNGGIGSILFVKRGGTIHLGHYFSAKLKTHHQKWLPCEIEALSITVSVHHFAPLIRESLNVTQILTDSRPCVQAWHKLLRGEFSSSARVATFLSTLSEFNIQLQHLKGTLNMPSDFQSRNPRECTSKSCQVCMFVSVTSDSVVRKVTVGEVLSGHAQVPYNNRLVWKDTQQSCPDLKRVHAHLSSGTRPSVKSKMTNVKRYLQKVIIGGDGVLVVIRSEPFLPRAELIVIPQDVVLGLLTALHLRLNHPTEHQLGQVFRRSFFALKLQHFAKVAIENCDMCQSLKTLPKELHSQSSIDLPVTPCLSYAADIVRRFRQKIFVLRETFSSFTFAELVQSEDAPTLRQSLCKSVSLLRSSPQVKAVVRVDNASGFVALKEDITLINLNMELDYGRLHNKNKNPVVDKGIRELISELLRINPEGGQTNSIELANAVNQLNSRIRGRGLSAWEILTRRDAVTGTPLDLSDEDLSNAQSSSRIDNQVSSAKSKARGGKDATVADVSVGSLVYIKDDLSKLKGRDRYIVVKKEGSEYTLKKLLKSNVRNKEYILKSTEIFPVVSNVLHNESYLRGYEDVIDDYEEEYDDHYNVQPVVAASNNEVSSVVHEQRYDGGGPFHYGTSFDEPSVCAPPVDPSSQSTVAVVPLTNESIGELNEESVPAVAVAPPRRGGRTSSTVVAPRRGGRTSSRPAWWGEYDTS